MFLNLQGREPEGCVAASEAESLRACLQRELAAITGPHGEVWDNRVERPEHLYRTVEGDAPDLLAFFDGLSVRALASVGASRLYAERDPRGGDAANHDPLGIFVLSGPGVAARGDLGECSIHDVGASVLSLFGVSPPTGWLGADRTRAA